MNLLEPIKIGSLELKNRIIMAAMNLGYADQGKVTERLMEFYRRRAEGGAGLVMVGGTAIEPTGVFGGFVSLHDDCFINGHKNLCQLVHNEGAAVGCQLFQAGRYSGAFLAGMEVYAPSPIASRFTGHTPHELTNDEVYAMIKTFGQAALRAREAGYDLVEVIMSAGYLIPEFLSPLTNHRTDEFGGNMENRMRFAVEVIREIRGQLGPDYPISVRLGGSDFIPGGNTLLETTLLSRELEKAGANLLNVTGGWHESYIPQISSEVPRANYVYLASAIKEGVSIPVATSNRINAPETAEQILGSGQADLITVARGFLADPDWGRKAKGELKAPIRKCIACMSCLHSLFEGHGVYCAINPEAGHEHEESLTVAEKALDILIIGAGPAGLEAARVAALRGHKVTIWEKRNSIGGQWNIAAVPPGKKEFSSLLEFYEQELQRLGVKIETNKEAVAEEVLGHDYDAIIAATGASPLNPAIPCDPKAPVVNAWDVLNGHPVKGPEVVVIGGGSVGCETALYVAEEGTISAETLKFLFMHRAEDPDTLYHLLTRSAYKLTVVEMGDHMASDMIGPIRWSVMKHMHLLNIKSMTKYCVCEIAEDSVTIVDRDNNYQTIPADTVIMAIGALPNQRLYEELKQDGKTVYLLGDAQTPAKVKDAIHASYELARSL